MKDGWGLIYLEYRDVPFDITYPSAWRQRGYKVREGEVPIAYLKDQLSKPGELLPLYGQSQTVRLRGQSAKRRRQAYISALYGEE